MLVLAFDVAYHFPDGVGARWFFRQDQVVHSVLDFQKFDLVSQVEAVQNNGDFYV